MIGTIVTMTLGMLGIRSLALLIFQHSRPVLIRVLDAIHALFFLAASALAFLFLGVRTKDHPATLLLALLVPGILITLSLMAAARKPYRSRPNLLAVKAIGSLVLLLIACVSVMVTGFRNLTEDEPLYRITMTGVSRTESVEWKSPQGALRHETLPAYEVRFETPDRDPVAAVFIYGDEVAVKARVLRLAPILNAAGIPNLCRVDYIYNGYRTAERFNEMPHRAQDIETSHPWLQPFQERFWSYWENSYFLRSNDPWVKSATLESTYFPLVTPEGAPFRGAYFLTLNSGGLSSVPLP